MNAKHYMPQLYAKNLWICGCEVLSTMTEKRNVFVRTQKPIKADKNVYCVYKPFRTKNSAQST